MVRFKLLILSAACSLALSSCKEDLSWIQGTWKPVDEYLLDSLELLTIEIGDLSIETAYLNSENAVCFEPEMQYSLSPNKDRTFKSRIETVANRFALYVDAKNKELFISDGNATTVDHERCIQLVSYTVTSIAGTDENTAYAYGYEGFTYIRTEPDDKADILCRFLNGPHGAAITKESEDNWTKVSLAGIEGYVRNGDIDYEPTEEVTSGIDAQWLNGLWVQDSAGAGNFMYIYANGTWGLGSKDEEIMTQAGTWRLKADRIDMKETLRMNDLDFRLIKMSTPTVRFSFTINKDVAELGNFTKKPLSAGAVDEEECAYETVKNFNRSKKAIEASR